MVPLGSCRTALVSSPPNWHFCFQILGTILKVDGHLLGARDATRAPLSGRHIRVLLKGVLAGAKTRKTKLLETPESGFGMVNASANTMLAVSRNKPSWDPHQASDLLRVTISGRPEYPFRDPLARLFRPLSRLGFGTPWDSYFGHYSLQCSGAPGVWLYIDIL